MATSVDGAELYQELTTATGSLTLSAYSTSGQNKVLSSIGVTGSSLIFPGGDAKHVFIWNQASSSSPNQTLSVYDQALGSLVTTSIAAASGVAAQVPDPISYNAYVLEANGVLHRLYLNYGTYAYDPVSLSGIYSPTSIPGTYPVLAIRKDGLEAFSLTTSALTVVDPINMKLLKSVNLAYKPIAVLASPSQAQAYIVGYTGSAPNLSYYLTIFNSSTNVIVNTVSLTQVAGRAILSVATSGDGNELLLASNTFTNDNGTVYIYNASSGSAISSVPAPTETPGVNGLAMIQRPLGVSKFPCGTTLNGGSSLQDYINTAPPTQALIRYLGSSGIAPPVAISTASATAPPKADALGEAASSLIDFTPANPLKPADVLNWPTESINLAAEYGQLPYQILYHELDHFYYSKTSLTTDVRPEPLPGDSNFNSEVNSTVTATLNDAMGVPRTFSWDVSVSNGTVSLGYVGLQHLLIHDDLVKEFGRDATGALVSALVEAAFPASATIAKRLAQANAATYINPSTFFPTPPPAFSCP